MDIDRLLFSLEMQQVFPKGHIVNYAKIVYQLLYLKTYYPLEFYAAYLGLNLEEIEIEMFFKSENEINLEIDRLHAKIKNIKKNKNKAINKIINKINILKIISEIVSSGIKFANVNLEKSDDEKFIVSHDENKLIIPRIFLDDFSKM